MPNLPEIDAAVPELTEIFRDLHAHPEIGMEEVRTSAVVAAKLREWGVDEVHEGVGRTGVVGILHGRGQGNRRIGLRADMDALPIHEATGLPHASTQAGKMHACGHDGHTTMLLGAAQYLARTRNFDGTAVLIFQPAEEGLGGARAMIADGLFQRFPVDEVYGMHNQPTGQPGRATLCKGPAMAGASFFDITVTGKGSHAAMPQQSRDALVAASGLVGQFQTILGRNVAPLDQAVLSVTQIHAGSAYNVVPETATLAGTIRFFRPEVRDLMQARMRAICEGAAQAFDLRITCEFREIFDVLVNDADLSDAWTQAAADVLGADNVRDDSQPFTGSEDFADMLQQVPGAYGNVGHAGTVPLHNPGFVLDESILPVGASIYARLIERRLPVAA
ncbi:MULTISPECIES: M20 aminoacylase family protein [Paracoccus]|uniref:M20 aminoacylase family protein n=1 Tax=Paracoccus TaxID=265 RepID=UPI000FDC5827|nr:MULTISPECIES: M20 aminoacylase family protein [Paracoccus]AZY94356.1 amidohydrolase [Paracoccus sp. Arc7-R13]TNC05207.1 amidohydrolase [Paracoccus marcusii]TYP60780.1 hippurate hydrolase [Stutzerimonas stutzeri]